MVKARVISFVALRYLTSKKSHSAINIISWVTVAAIAIPTAAMIILLSVHNGFEQLISTLWGGYGASLVVEPRNGGLVSQGEFPIDKLNTVMGVEYLSPYIESELLIKYKGKQVAVNVRGIDSTYISATSLKSCITHGGSSIGSGAIVGLGVAHSLGLRVNLSGDVTFLAPRDGAFRLFSANSYYQELDIAIEGLFMIDAQRDMELSFIERGAMASLCGYGDKISAIALGLKSGTDIDDIKSKVADVLGDDFVVKDLEQQNLAEYQMVRSEKFAIYMIMLLVMVVASLTMVGAMIMLIVEKRKSSNTLMVLGFSSSDIKRLFITLGGIISLIGVVIGLVLGVGVVLSQQIFEFVPIYGAGMLVDSYPVRLMIGDVVVVIISVWLINLLLSYFSCSRR